MIGIYVIRVSPTVYAVWINEKLDAGNTSVLMQLAYLGAFGTN